MLTPATSSASMGSPEFTSDLGLKQGDNLSPTCFSLFIDGLLKVLRREGVGLDVNGIVINNLAYADDIMILSQIPEELQQLLNVMHDWCKKWRISINKDKTKVVHFR